MAPGARRCDRWRCDRCADLVLPGESPCGRSRSRFLRLCRRGYSRADFRAHADSDRVLDLDRNEAARGTARQLSPDLRWAAALRRAVFLLIETRDASFRLWLEYEPRTDEWALPSAREALGTATLFGWRFVINPEGFGSIAPRPGARVYGVLWRLTARDLAAINAYESVDAGSVSAPAVDGAAGRTRVERHHLYRALERRGDAAAGLHRSWWSTRRVIGSCPSTYVRSLARWAPSGWRGARARDTGELG